MKIRTVLLLLVIAGAVWAQDEPPQQPVVPPPPPEPVTLVNAGKPIVLPFECTRDDVGSAGFSCSEDAPCPVYLELSAATGVGSNYYVAGDIHSDAVTLYSVLLGSDDAGKSWHEVHKRIRAAGLDHLQFVDAQTGWAGGEQLFPLPQDPFIIQTNDGGKTWRGQLIFGENSDYHFGSLHEMFFASKTNGSVIVDRSSGGDPGPFALYDTSDGGASWSIKDQNAKPLHIRNSPAPDTEWRVRVDAATKAFQVEHRQGEAWSSKSSFAVNIGVCKLGAQ